MTIVAAIGGGAFVLASLVLGVRLVLLARRTRGFPELVLGASLFLMAGIGYPLGMIGMQAHALPTAVRVAMVVGNMVCLSVGMTALACFTHRVFRPGQRGSQAAVVGIALGFCAGLAAQAWGPGFASFLENPYGPWRTSVPVSLIASTWAGGESLRYWWLLRRRLPVGLADPVVVDRFRLWATAMLLASFITFVSMVAESLGVPMMGTPAGALLVGPLGLVIAGSLWLAFLPPAWWVRHVRARAGRTADPAGGSGPGPGAAVDAPAAASSGSR